MPYIEFKNVCKQYKMGEVKINALENSSLSLDKMYPVGSIFFSTNITKRLIIIDN